MPMFDIGHFVPSKQNNLSPESPDHHVCWNKLVVNLSNIEEKDSYFDKQTRVQMYK